MKSSRLFISIFASFVFLLLINPFAFSSEKMLFEISLSKPYLRVAEIGKVSLSVANPNIEDKSIDITLTVGNGVEIKSVEAGDQCAGSICKLDRRIIPAGGKEDIIILLEGISGATSVISAHLNYKIDGKDVSEDKTVNIIVPQCGNGIIEQSETSSNCCEDVFCPGDELIYGYNCNKIIHSCDKKIKTIVYLVFLLVLIIVLTPIIKYLIGSRLYLGKIRDIFGMNYVYNRTGRNWSSQEKSQLKHGFLLGKSIPKLAREHKREPDAIKHSLIRCRLIGFRETSGKYKMDGEKWTLSEENTLKKEYSKDKDILRISRILSREPNAILHNLINLGLINDIELLQYQRRK